MDPEPDQRRAGGRRPSSWSAALSQLPGFPREEQAAACCREPASETGAYRDADEKRRRLESPDAAQHRAHPDHARRQPDPARAAAAVHPREAVRPAVRPAGLRCMPCQLGRRDRARAGRRRRRRAERRRVRQGHQLVAVRARAPERLRAPAARRPARSRFQRGADRTRFAEFYAELDAATARRRRPARRRARRSASRRSATPARPRCSATSTTSRRRSRPPASRKASCRWPRPASVIPDRKNEYYKNDEEMPRGDRATRCASSTGRSSTRACCCSSTTRASRSPTTAWCRRRACRTTGTGSSCRSRRINHALDGIPEDRVRYHVCWGSWPGPHTTDVPLKDIVDLVLRVRAGAYLIEGANPRHEHEWRVWEDVKLPDGSVLIPGVISHATNVVEHPELVAERIVRFAKLRRPRERDGRHRLRLRAGPVPPPRAPVHHVGEARGARRRRAHSPAASSGASRWSERSQFGCLNSRRRARAAPRRRRGD